MRVMPSAWRRVLFIAVVGAAWVPGVFAQEPAGYALNPGDVLQVSVWKETELTREVLVRPDGKISFPHRVLRQQRWREPMTYIAKAQAGDPVSNEHEVARDELAFEFMLNALRLREGFSTQMFVERTGLPLSAIEPALHQAEARGLIERGATSVRPSAKGFDFLTSQNARFNLSAQRPYVWLMRGRTHAQLGQKEEARKSYQKFFDIFKDADPDLPLLLEARGEFAKFGS